MAHPKQTARLSIPAWMQNGTLKAKLNVEGNKMMDAISKTLDFPFKRNGSLVVCTSKDEIPKLEALKRRGENNGVQGLRIIYREELLKMEPNIADGVFAALFAPTGGIVCPFNMTIGYAENAAVNGVEFKMDTAVAGTGK